MSNMICRGKGARSPALPNVAPGRVCSSSDRGSLRPFGGIGTNGSPRCVNLVPERMCSGQLCNRIRNSRKLFSLS